MDKTAGNLASSVSGIILAGGLSRRVGQEKAWLPWDGWTLLSHVAGLIQPVVREVIVVTRPGQAVPATCARVVTDRVSGAGPLGGLEAGLAALQDPYGMVVACDMPWLNPGLLQAMAALAPDWDLVIPRLNGRYQPIHAIYAKRLLSKVTDLLSNGEHRVHSLAAQSKVLILEEPFIRAHDPSCLSLKGLNTWGEYQGAFCLHDTDHGKFPPFRERMVKAYGGP